MKTITKQQYWDLPLIEMKNFTGIIKWDVNSQTYYQNSLYHRIDGPAVEHSDGQASYWINGIKTTKEGQELYYSLLKLKGLL